jgi:hypothetical protein
MSDKPKPLDAAARKAELQERAIERAKARSDYKAEGDAERAKTARLRALRLGQEAADKVAKQAKPTKKRTK